MPKPKKPYANFPLTPHARGGWGKKYKGRQLYFPQRDPAEALAAFHARANAIDDGKDAPPAPAPGGPILADVVNRYVIERGKDVAAGKLSDGALSDYSAAARDLCDSAGPRTPVADLTPDHFTALYRKWEARGLKAHAMGRNVQAVRTIFNHAEQNDWIDRRPRYGSIFRKPLTGKKVGEPPTLDELRAVLGVATGQLRAMILLALNGGYGARDCSQLPRSAVDLERGLIVFPRPKMKNRRPVDRVMVLWPGTAAALADVISERPGDPLVFRTAFGAEWVRFGSSKKGKDRVINSVGLMFRRLCEAAGVRRLKFSDLRHVHRTLADELEKPHAAARIMGHRLPGLAEVYVDRIEHGRLRVLTEWIRGRLYGGRTISELQGRPAPSPAAKRSPSAGAG